MNKNVDSSVESGRKVLNLNIVRAEAPYEAVFLKSDFPAREDELPAMNQLLERIIAAAVQGRKLNLEAFVQVNPLAAVSQMPLMTDHAREWQPIIGLGIWPDREPPTSWTKEDFLKLLPGQAPRIARYRVCRISAPGKVREQAWRSLLGTGAALAIFTSEDGSSFLQKMKDVLLRPVQDKAFRHSQVYVPILECKSFESTRPEQLESWLCGASLYIRESTEDKGVLIASREPLRPILEKLGATTTGEPPSGWRIPC